MRVYPEEEEYSDKISGILSDVVYSLPEDIVFVDEDAVTYFALPTSYIEEQSSDFLQKIVIAMYLMHKFDAWDKERDVNYFTMFENIRLIEEALKSLDTDPLYRQHFDSDFEVTLDNYLTNWCM